MLLVSAALAVGQEPVLQWDTVRRSVENGEVAAQLGDVRLASAKSPKFITLEVAALNDPLQWDQECAAWTAEFAAELATLRKKVTVSSWACLDDFHDWGGLVSCFEDTGEFERGWVLGFRGSSACFGLTAAETGRIHYLRSERRLPKRKWFHLVGTYDGRNQALYLDGELIASHKYDKRSEVLYDDSHQFALGAYLDSNENFLTSGAMLRTSIFADALSKKEVKALFKKERKEFGELLQRELPQHETEIAEGELAGKVNRAIDHGVNYLLEQQLRDGSWAQQSTGYRNGITSLNALALIHAGVPTDHPSIVNAVRFLREHPPRKVYSAGIQLMLYAELGQDDLLADAEEVVDLLLEWEPRYPGGLWGYPGGAPDLSNTQFVALGFWSAERMQIELPDEVWIRLGSAVVEHCRAPAERIDGGGRSSAGRLVQGFHYGTGDYPAYGGMTVAGISALHLVEMCGPNRLPARLKKEIATSKQLALRWLEEKFQADENPGFAERINYYLYGVERVAALMDLDSIGRHDWYRAGALALLERQRENGSWVNASYGAHVESATSFALLFLSRATAASTGGETRSARGMLDPTVVQVEACALETAMSNDHRGRVYWAAGLPKALQAAGEYDLEHVRAVSYRLNGVAHPVQLSPSEVDRRLAWRLPELAAGMHSIQMSVTLANGEILQSAEFEFEVRNRPALVQRAALELRRGLQQIACTAIAEVDFLSDESDASVLCDGLQLTGIKFPTDLPAAQLELQLDRASRADALIISSYPASFLDSAPGLSGLKLELELNGNEVEIATPLEVRSGEILIRLPKSVKIRHIRLKLDELYGKNGISEIGLYAHTG